jgi:hypothetical protein
MHGFELEAQSGDIPVDYNSWSLTVEIPKIIGFLDREKPPAF